MTTSLRTRSGLGSTLKYGVVVTASFIAMIPILAIVMVSLKSKAEVADGGPFQLPQDWLNFSNYETAFFDGQMAGAFVNTAIILVTSVVGTVLIGSMAAYAINRFEFRLKPLVLFLFLLAALVPAVTTQVATFQVINTLGLFNTRWSAILLYMGTDILSIYIFLQFMRGVPRALDEAALIDGASHWTIYRKIALPLLKPAIVTVVVIKGVAIYNEFYIPFLYMPARDLGVVSTSLFRFNGPFNADYQVIAAAVVIAMIPTLIIFLALQRFIYNGFARGAVK
jgi:multiple sugar transport system permease protein